MSNLTTNLTNQVKMKYSLTHTGVVLFLSLLLPNGVLTAQDVAAPAPEPTVTTNPPRDFPPVQQQEIARKQEQVFLATKSLDEAKNDEDSKQYDKARKIYLAALAKINLSNSTKAVYDRAVKGLLRVNSVLIDQALAAGDAESLDTLLQSSLAYDPKNQDLKGEYEKLQKARKDPTNTEYLTNPATKKSFTDKVQKVQDLLTEAEQYRLAGRYDESELDLSKVLAIDPYNESATRSLDKLVKEKSDYAEAARLQTRDERLQEVDSKWVNPTKSTGVADATVVSEEPLTRSNEFAITQKLKSIIFPAVDFDDYSLQDAISFLTVRTSELDLPSKKGINFIPSGDVYAGTPKFSLHLHDIPLGEALRYITLKAGVKYKVDPNGIFIVKQSAVTESLVHRVFRVTPGFLTSAGPASPTGPQTIGGPSTSGASAAPISTDSVVTETLKEKGVKFDAPGSQAFYLAGPGELNVTNTQDQIDLIEELVNADSTPTKMVEIQVKLVEINQQDLNDVTANVTYNMFGPASYATAFTQYIPGANALVGTFGLANPVPSPNSPQFNSQLRGSSGFNTNTLQSLESTASTYSTTNSLINYGSSSPATHRFEIGGVLDGRTFTLLLSALSQKTSTDVLSSPTVRGNAGTVLSVNLSRSFYFPSAFSPPKVVTIQINNNNGATTAFTPPSVIPAFPTEFNHEDLGVTMQVNPTVGPDNRSVGMHIKPAFSEFEGFINYGTAITIADGFTGISHIIANNQIPQPVFNRRLVDTTVTVKDGYTVVMGGFIREDVESINDKVPILGDIPMVGRLFQSKADKHTKKNMLIFVTPRILGPDGELFNAGNTPVASAGH